MQPARSKIHPNVGKFVRLGAIADPHHPYPSRPALLTAYALLNALGLYTPCTGEASRQPTLDKSKLFMPRCLAPTDPFISSPANSPTCCTGRKTLRPYESLILKWRYLTGFHITQFKIHPYTQVLRTGCANIPSYPSTLTLPSTRTAVTMSPGTRGYIQGRVLVKKADGLQGKAAVGHGHDGPVFGAGDVVVAKDVPQHHIGVVDGAIARRPLRQSLTAGVLVGVGTSGEIFIGRVGGNPEVMLQKARPLCA
jgi:hypothetical protein